MARVTTSQMSLLTSLLLVGTSFTAHAADFQAEVRTTSYGIPHIKADDWAGLGYGYGYAYSGDNFCILAREVLAANGQLARYFGDSTGNTDNDFFYALVNNDAYVSGVFGDLQEKVQDALLGFVAGYNRRLTETGVSNLPEDCRDAAWVRPLDELDLVKVFYKLILRASGGPLSSLIVSAQPPSARAATGVPNTPGAVARRLERNGIESISIVPTTSEIGSNMYALGANATASGKGMLLGNPHFDWNGPLRWYQVHLTIPGQLDVMGASLQGVPLVNIGFNENFAWSHTVSPADRFTLFELTLVDGNPTQYLYDGVVTDMTTDTVSIEVLVDDELELREHTFYSSVHGLVLDFAPVFGFTLWGTTAAYAVGDANVNNFRAIDHFLGVNEASTLDDFLNVLNTNVGLPWVHTTAADRNGVAYYGDVSVVPNVTQAKKDACPTILGGLIESLAGIKVLDGAQAACEFGTDPDSPTPGIFGASNLPSLTTQDYVSNSNDNHWLTNPEQPLEGFAPTLQAERTARSLRTRLSIVQVRERLAGTDGLGAPLFTLETLQDTLFGSRNYAAELLLSDLVAVCFAEGPTVDVGGETIDVSEACDVLSNWDGHQNIDSVGPHIFLEFLESAFDDLADPILSDLFDTPFDVEDPVNTPRGLRDETQTDRNQLMEYLGLGVQRLMQNGLALDALWGDLQYETKNGVRYPVHGGRDGSGMFSIITANLSPEGYTPIVHGNSYIQTVTFDDNGPVAEALLTYSQSSDPANPHYADQTALLSNKQWVRLPFSEQEILDDPNYTTATISEARDSDRDGLADDVDNCTLVSNIDQTDTDADGYGNACDGDFNQDGMVNFPDLILFKAAFITPYPLYDLNGNGVVDIADYVILRELFFKAPGPAAMSE